MEKNDELREMADKIINLREQSGSDRMGSVGGFVNLEIMLVAHSDEVAKMTSKGASKETRFSALMKICPECEDYFKDWKLKEAHYKGLNDLADAHNAKLILEMAIMKRNDIGEKRGY